MPFWKKKVDMPLEYISDYPELKDITCEQCNSQECIITYVNKEKDVYIYQFICDNCSRYNEIKMSRNNVLNILFQIKKEKMKDVSQKVPEPLRSIIKNSFNV